MQKILVIGYGNTLREDDAIGVLVAESLQEEACDEAIRYKVVQQLMPELAKDMSESDTVIFIDASVEIRPGETKKEQLRCQPDSTTSNHHFFTAQHLLNLCYQLYNQSPSSYLYSMGVESIELKEGLSNTVQSQFDSFKQLIYNDLDLIINNH